MSVSIEALAMAGADYSEWEHEDLELTPPHLLADQEDEEEEERIREHNFSYGFSLNHFSLLNCPDKIHGDDDDHSDSGPSRRRL
ncbi:hypothetical protein CRYUN_Cryun15aG0093800 [Craigia yunnanensis]